MTKKEKGGILIDKNTAFLIILTGRSQVKNMGNMKKLLNNTALFSAGKLISKLLVFFMLPLYTKYLSSDQFSTADLITNMANLLIPLACVGISDGIYRNAAAEHGNKEKFFSSGVTIYAVGSVVFLALSPLLSLIGLFRGYSWLIAVYVVVANLHSICAQYVCAIGKVKIFAIQGIVNSALTVIFNIILLVGFRAGIIGYVMAIILADGVTATLLIILCKLPSAFNIHLVDKATVRSMLRFSIPLIPATICWWITSVSDRYMVAYYCGDSVNGLYAVAYKIPTLMTYAVMVFNDAWKLSATSMANNKEECEKTFGTIYKYYISFMYIVAAALIFGSYIMSSILFDESYFDARYFIPLLVIATLFSALDTFLGSVYFVTKKTVVSMLTALAGAVINVALNFWMIPAFGLGLGAAGAALSTLISYAAVFLIRALITKRYIKFNMQSYLTILNTTLISVSAFAMSSVRAKIGFRYLLSGCVLIVIVALNFSNMIDFVRAFINERKRKNRKQHN